MSGRKSNQQRKLTHKETVAQITAENRAYFARMGSPAEDTPPAEIQTESVEPQLTHRHFLQLAVKDAIEKQFAQNAIAPVLFKVISCDLAPVSGSQYAGCLTVEVNGTVELVTIEVTIAGETFTWRRQLLSFETSHKPSFPESNLVPQAEAGNAEKPKSGIFIAMASFLVLAIILFFWGSKIETYGDVRPNPVLTWAAYAFGLFIATVIIAAFSYAKFLRKLLPYIISFAIAFVIVHFIFKLW